jgi:hypothetical protein
MLHSQSSFSLSVIFVAYAFVGVPRFYLSGGVQFHILFRHLLSAVTTDVHNILIHFKMLLGIFPSILIVS